MDLPLVNSDLMQATCSPSSKDFSLSVASPSKSGTANAIEGILLANCCGICWEPVAEKLPAGTDFERCQAGQQGDGGIRSSAYLGKAV